MTPVKIETSLEVEASQLIVAKFSLSYWDIGIFISGYFLCPRNSYFSIETRNKRSSSKKTRKEIKFGIINLVWMSKSGRHYKRPSF